MIHRLQRVVPDCPDPRAPAVLHRGMPGGDTDRPDPRWSLDDDWATLHLGDGRVPAFQRADPYEPPRWPDPRRPQRVHPDVGVTDLEAARDAAVALGAEVLDAGGPRTARTVCGPRAGHPFCLVRE
ncbi:MULTISPECIES: VOC family protein [Streptomyces]|uniref:Glyoxalase n=2 Tax=Streptomyces TaxID=1883 RepID=A0A117IWW5_9ACTN|nr:MULTISPECIES: VOC family protein [Streptomyces]KUH39157.1 glyoxalase [Streptomyces kanasensis]UUS33805.1 VOC family protein [Streptomyces changanensis]